jgi:hypothetical protein
LPKSVDNGNLGFKEFVIQWMSVNRASKWTGRSARKEPESPRLYLASSPSSCRRVAS